MAAGSPGLAYAHELASKGISSIKVANQPAMATIPQPDDGAIWADEADGDRDYDMWVANVHQMAKYTSATGTVYFRARNASSLAVGRGSVAPGWEAPFDNLVKKCFSG